MALRQLKYKKIERISYERRVNIVYIGLNPQLIIFCYTYNEHTVEILMDRITFQESSHCQRVRDESLRFRRFRRAR